MTVVESEPGIDASPLLDDGSRGAFFAHSIAGEPEGRWQPLSRHLEGVGDMAAEFAISFGQSDLARVAGLLHDLGKYTAAFQHRLRGGATVDHAAWGAKVAIERYPGALGS